MNDNEYVTVKDLIEFLKKNFNENDRLCFFDEGGAWCELVHVHKNLIGDWFFKYVKDKREHEIEHSREDMLKYIDEEYRFVRLNDVVIY